MKQTEGIEKLEGCIRELIDCGALELLRCLDILVDGEFVEEKKNIRLKFRGSENQRLIDVPRSLAESRVVLWDE